jgi:poly [ADP-ribose] polymerase
MDYSTGGKTEEEVKEEMEDLDEPKKEQKPIPESTLDDRVQTLLKLICDIRAMEETVTELEYDAVKAPLGISIFLVKS